MVKRISFVLLALLIVLTGCSSGTNERSNADNGGTDQTGDSSGTEVKQIELDFPSWQASEGGFANWWKALIAEYEKQHPNVEINFYQIPFAQYVDQLTTRFVASEPPDIVHLPSSVFPQFADQDWLKSLDEKLQETDIPDTWTPLQEKMVWDDETQGVLLLGYPFMLYYNEKLLADAGVSVPTNHEELLAAAKQLTKDGIYGFGLTTAQHPDVYGDATITLTGLGQNWVEDGKYNITSPEFVEAMNVHRELFNYSPKGIPSEQKRQLFFDGKIAMMLEGPFVMESIQTAPEDVRPHIKIGPAPFEVTPGAVSNSLHMPENISPENEKYVWEFIKLAASPEWQAKYAEMTKTIAPRENSVPQELIEEIPAMQVLKEETPRAVLTEPDSKNVQANINMFSKLVSSYIIKLMTTNEPTESILSDLEKELNSKVQP